MQSGIVYAVSVGFAAGVALQTVWSVSLWGLYMVAGTALVVAFISHLSYLAPRKQDLARLVSLALLFFMLGVWRMDVVQEQLETPGLDEMVYETDTHIGTVVREPEIRQQSQHVHLETETTRILLVADRHEVVKYGDTLSATGRLEVPEPFAAELGRTFPYDGYLAARGITHMLFYPDIQVLDTGSGNPVISMLLLNKEHFMHRLESLIPEPQVGLGEGLVLGVRRAMDDATLTDFRTTGIIHIVVLSGFNVMLVVAFVQYVFSYFLSLRPRIVASLVAITCYAITVGLTATVVRASIMATLLLVAQYVGRTYEAIRGLFVAGALMVAFNPYLLVYDIGFQLSFVATLGLILVAPHLETLFATVPAKVGARGYVVATIATQIAVLPLLLYHVGEFSVVSPFVNLLILPMVPVAMLFVFLTGVVSLISVGLAQPLALAAYVSLGFILLAAEWFARLPFAAFWVPAFPFAWVPVCYGVLGWMYWWYTHRSVRVTRPEPVVPVRSDAANLAGWTIVDVTAPERSVSQIHETAASSQQDEAAVSEEETPVFFR